MRAPWTESVRNAYISGRGGWQEGTEDKAGAEFDRWLEGVRREAKAEALEEAADKATDPMWVLFDSDYDNALVAAWLQGRAEDIKKGENR